MRCTLHIHIIETNHPVIDNDAGIDPFHAFVQEESHVVLVLAVEILLIGHVMTFGFGEQQVFHQGDGENRFAGLGVGDSQLRIVFFHQSAYCDLGYRHADVVVFGSRSVTFARADLPATVPPCAR